MKEFKFKTSDYMTEKLSAKDAAAISNALFQAWLDESPPNRLMSCKVTSERLRQIRFKNWRLWEENQRLQAENSKMQEMLSGIHAYIQKSFREQYPESFKELLLDLKELKEEE